MPTPSEASGRGDCVQVERRGAVAWLWMNRPEVHNAFDDALVERLTRELTALDGDAGVRAVVLAGRGTSFSAGADLGWMKRQAAAPLERNLEDARRLAALFRTLARLRAPTVARVHGAALGGGLGLAAACDICVASREARFATTEVRLGLVPSVIGPYVIQAIGARQASRWFQTGERMSADRARELGLAHEVCAPERLDDEVQRIVDALLAGGPGAQAAATDLIRAVAARPIDDALVEETASRIAALRASAEAREGFDAFLERRPPAWAAPRDASGEGRTP